MEDKVSQPGADGELRHQKLGPAYRDAFLEWSPEDEATWDVMSADGNVSAAKGT